MQGLKTPAYRGAAAPQLRQKALGKLQVKQQAWSRHSSCRVQAGPSVPVTITLNKEIAFGESLKLVGNQSFLGDWDIGRGYTMVWHEGNVWQAKADVAVGADVCFKIVRTRDQEILEWEQGEDRKFRVLGPDFALNISCNWCQPHDMKVEALELAKAMANGTGNGSSHQSGQAPAGAATPVAHQEHKGSNGSSNGAQGNGINAKSISELANRGASAWVGAAPEFVRERKKDGDRSGTWNTDGLKGVELELVKGDQQSSSWLKKLELQKKMLVDTPPQCRPQLPELAAAYVYASWINTGALPCTESGSHFRPNHHANLALAMFRSLEWVIGDVSKAPKRDINGEKVVMAARRMHKCLPSFSGEFRQTVPLTRIRDIAHRNDIPSDIKSEIKHTLQNKLHRSAGPEDLVATEKMLVRITENPGQYSQAFVDEFKVFTKELREFFNASGLVELIEGTKGALDEGHASAVNQFLTAKARVEGGGKAKLEDLMQVLVDATQARSHYSAGLRAGLRNDVTDETLSMRQRWRLADIRLEEYCFLVLSQIINALDEEDAVSKLSKGGNQLWSIPMAALTSGLRQLGLSQFNTPELLALENELQKWHGTAPITESRDGILRAKASLERALRVCSEYSDALAEVYTQTASDLGKGLGVPEHMARVFAESEVRASIAFQVSKLATLLVKALRLAAGLEAWDVLVPGTVSGVLREADRLDPSVLADAKEDAILLVKRADGDEELGPLGSRLAGVVLCQELPHLSHLGVRARQEKVTFVTCDDRDFVSAKVKPLLGKYVTMTVTADTVTLTESQKQQDSRASSSAQAGTSASASASAKGMARPGLPKSAAAAVSSKQWEKLLLGMDAVSAESCGAKSAKCAELEKMSKASGSLFKTPKGSALPFGTMDTVLQLAGAKADYDKLLKELEKPDLNGSALDELVGKLQALISKLQVPPQLLEAVSKVHGSSTLLAVRSSANVEDLAGMSAAGLYESKVGVPAGDSAALNAAICAVWASLYTRRAVLSRRSAGVPQSAAAMSVLIQELMVPELSFVLHTARPSDANPDILLAEVAPGQGETLASGVRGTPWRFEVEKQSSKVKTLAFANFSQAFMLPKAAKSGSSNGSTAGGLQLLDVDYGKQRLSVDTDWRDATVKRMAAAGQVVEKQLQGVAQDIEGGLVAVTPGGDASNGELELFLFQTRPQ